jgi:hypothetical protein
MKKLARIRVSAILVFLSLAAMAFTGCKKADAGASGAITIGGIFPLSGPVAE